MEAKDIETLVGELETNVDRLRALYEQYFMGIEKIVPAVPHKDVERRIYALRKEQIRNTAVRFRFQMIIQRYNTYQTHWQRICRQIEEGTYKRDRLRAERRVVQQAPEAPAPAPEEAAPPPPPKAEPIAPQHVRKPTPPRLELDDAAFFDLDISAALPKPPPSTRSVAEAPKAPPPPPPPQRKAPPPLPPRAAGAPPPPKPPSPSPDALSDQRMKQIYAEYLRTHRAQKENTPAMTYDALSKTLRDSSAKLRPKHGNVDFEVAVKEGKTILRAVKK